MQENLDSNIWRILDIFRGENANVDDYYVALLFMSLERTKSLPVAYHFSEKGFYEYLNKFIKEIGGKISKIFLPIIPHFEGSIRKLSHHGLNDLIFEIHSLVNENPPSDFSEAFDHVLYRISGAQGRHGGEIVQPVELTKFLMNLADLPANAKTFNPFAGLASFGVFLNKGQHYYGQELNLKTWAIGQLRLFAYDRTEFTWFVAENSTENWPQINESFDLVISHPPFLNFNVSDPNSQSQKVVIKNRSFEYFLVDQGIQLLKKNGKLIAVVSQGFLFRSSIEGQLRKDLVDEDKIDTIISLPGGILSNTGIPVIILVINLNKSHPGLIRFIDGNDFVKNINRNEKLLNYTSLSELTHSPFEDSENVRIIRADQIRENNYNLHVPRYFQKQIEGIKLKDLLESIKFNYAKTVKDGKIVKIRDLKDDRIEFLLSEDKIATSEVRQAHIKEIRESCLLLATRWKSLKPTWFEYTGESIYLRPGDIYPFKIKESLVDKAFLINELHADYVQEQLESYRVGTIIPFIRTEDLLEVVVKIPSIGKQNSLDLQKAKFQGVFEETLKLKEKESDFDKQLAEFIENQVRDFQSLKHTIRQYLSPLKSNVSGTRKFLRKNEGKAISLNMIYSKNLNQTLNQHLFSIEEIIDSINKLLLQNEQKQLNTGSSDLIELIQSCQRKFKQEDIFFFTEPEIDEESLKDNEGNTIKPILGLSEDQFEALFSNVIDNAVKHGFKEKRPGFMVKVSIGYANDTIKMIISNNGAPLEEGFTKKHLTTLGEKTTDSKGTGTGGADIKKIVDLAGGSFDIISNPKADLFKVSYIFEFPLIIEE